MNTSLINVLPVRMGLVSVSRSSIAPCLDITRSLAQADPSTVGQFASKNDEKAYARLPRQMCDFSVKSYTGDSLAVVSSRVSALRNVLETVSGDSVTVVAN